MKLSGPEKRALKLFSQIGADFFERNETDRDSHKKVRKLVLSTDEKGTSVLKSNGLLFDDPKVRRPKKYTRMEPDWIWQDNFIEVKDKIMGNNWEELGRDSLNDQLRILLLRLKNDSVSGLARYRFVDLMRNEQLIVKRDLARFKKSQPNDRCYVRWGEILSAIPSPNDNFEISSIEISDFQLPVRVVMGLGNIESPRLYLLDNEMMDRWEQVLF